MFIYTMSNNPSMAEILDIVDEKDHVVSKATKEEMIDKKLLHRSSLTLVFNSKGEIFIHMRAKNKRTYLGMWAVFFGGSLRSGETYEEGAKRELLEESGIKNVDLKFIFKERFTNKDEDLWAKVYSCVYNDKLNLQKSEIEKGRFVSKEELKQMVKTKKFCPDDIAFFKTYTEIMYPVKKEIKD
jgi:isopentenyldiphosphate isomerase